MIMGKQYRSAIPAISDAIQGADVAHDHEGSATQGNQPSCAAVVGSLDSHAVKYAAISTIQGRQELIDTDELCKMIMVGSFPISYLVLLIVNHNPALDHSLYTLSP